MSASDQIKSAGTIIVTTVIFILVAGWSFAVWRNLGEAPVYRGDGSVRLDKFARAKDILVLVLPLLTTTVGYWLGSQGAAKAETRAVTAETKADTEQKKKEALLAEATPDILQAAEARYGETFR